MSAFVLAMLLGTGEPADALLASGDMLPIASEKLRECVVYHAVRVDDGSAPVDDLIAAARVHCATKLSIFRYILRGFVKAKNPSADADVITEGSELSVFRQASNEVSKLAKAGRNN